MSDEVVISSFSKNALSQIEDYLGIREGVIRNNIISSSTDNTDDSSYGNKNSKTDELDEITSKINKLKEQLSANDEMLRDSYTQKFREEVKLAKDRTKWRKDIKEENKTIQDQISLLENKSKIIKNQISEEERINTAYKERAKIIQKINTLSNSKKVARWINEYGVKAYDIGNDTINNVLIAKGISQAVGAVGNSIGNTIKNIDKKEDLTISQVGSTAGNIAGMIPIAGPALSGVASIVTSIIESYDRINEASSKYARNVGGGAAKMEDMKTYSVDLAKSLSTITGLSYSFESILQHTSELSTKTGRSMDRISKMDTKSLEDLTRFGISTDVLNQYDTFGLTIEEIDKHITDIYKTSSKHGLNAKAVTDAVNKNLKMAQQYTFAGGLKALERMAEKSVALKYNMQSVARFADKVSTLEGAMQTGAQLSVLGGSFARMGNPLSLLYGGLQDAEQLNEMMLNMTKNLVHWDSRLGEMRMSAQNRMMLRTAAQSMNVDVNDMQNQAYRQAYQNIIDKSISGGIDEETRKYIRNIATVRASESGNPEAVVKIRTGKKDDKGLDVYEDKLVSKLTESDKEALKRESEDLDTKNAAKIGDILIQTKTVKEDLTEFFKWFKSHFYEAILKIAGYDEKVIRAAAENNLSASEAKELIKQNRRNKYIGAGIGSTLGGIGGAWGGAAGGAAIGTAIAPGLGTAIGALLGGALGGILGTYGGGTAGYYTGNALHKADKRAKELVAKRENNIENKAHGGIIRGAGTSTSDSIPARLSNGEFVMNAKATQRHLPTLQAWNNAEGFASGTQTPIKAGNNTLNSLSVKQPLKASGIQTPSMQSLRLDPISININGTIKLDAGNGNARDINASELLSNNMFVSELIRRIQIATDYALIKDKSHLKYPIA